MTEFNGIPFQYNPAITNVNIDNQLAGILSQLGDDYILDIVKDSINDRFRIYDLPRPNIVNAFEITFKDLTNGFTSNTDEIYDTRKRVYNTIINIICDYYNFTFNSNDDTDLYSAAYWLYDIFVSNFTTSLINFYTLYLIRERYPINTALGLSEMNKINETTYTYSKRLFKDPNLASIHCNLEYVIDQISNFDISIDTILNTIYNNANSSVASYVTSIISDNTGMFFKKYYESFIYGKEAADILTQIKLNLQQLGSEIEPLEPFAFGE